MWSGEAWTPPGFLSETTLEEDGGTTAGQDDGRSGQPGGVPAGATPRAWPPSVGAGPRSSVPEMPLRSEAAPAEGEGGDAKTWRPPNRIEPPARFQTPSGSESEATPRGGNSIPAASGAAPVTAARPTPLRPVVPSQQQRGGYSAPPAADTVQQYPEARTLALLAEDLLGRPLDAPPVPPPGTGTPAPEPAAGPPQPAWTPAARRTIRGGGDDLWDQVMPLWDESSSSSSE